MLARLSDFLSPPSPNPGSVGNFWKPLFATCTQCILWHRSTNLHSGRSSVPRGGREEIGVVRRVLLENNVLSGATLCGPILISHRHPAARDTKKLISCERSGGELSIKTKTAKSYLSLGKRVFWSPQLLRQTVVATPGCSSP